MASASAPTELLRTELERLFELEQLQKLSTELLGLDPADVGGNNSKAPFARALVERCAQEEMLEALADAIILTERSAESRLKGVYEGKSADDLAVGSTVEGFKIQKKLHDEGFGTVYLAQTTDGKQVTLKVLRDARVRDRRGLQRFLLAQRALKRVEHPAVIRIVAVGVLPDGRPYLASEFLDGQLLSARLARTGAMHINEARTIFEAIADGLDAAHKAGIAHSDLRTEHVVLVRRPGGLSGVIVDFAVDRLSASRPGEIDGASMLVLIGSARCVAPERVRSGAPADVRSDVYAFGALAYETLTGKPVFQGTTPMELLVAHATQTPELPSKLAQRGYINRELDVVLLKALAKDPAERYATAGDFYKAMLDALKGKRTGDITKEEFETRRTAVFENPADDEKALALEGAGTQGIPWTDVLAAFTEAAKKTSDTAAKRALLFRAARVAQLEVKELPKARELYEELVKLDDKDEVARAKLQEIKMQLATPEEKAELLLEEAEKEELLEKKAELYRSLASVYEKELKDPENALVALTEALVAAPFLDETAREIERVAGDNPARWNEVLQPINEAIAGKDPAAGAQLLVRAGRWYAERLARPDFAVACFTRALSLDAGNDAALEGAGQIYRKAQQWPELVAVLLRRADAQASPVRARDFRAEAADLLESKLNDRVRSRDLAEKTLADDPAQQRAAQVLERILIAEENWKALVSLLERKADALTGPGKADAFNEIAETCEDRLKDDNAAASWYERARSTDPRNVGALKGLERLYARTSDTEKLLRVLEAQVPLAATPRQKVELYLRVAAIYEEEFVDHKKASESFEAASLIDRANEQALTGLARLYRVTQRWDDLVALLERHASFVEDNKRKADLHVARGRVLLDSIGSLDRAGAAIDKALESDANHSGALEAAARIRALRGDVKAAAEALDALAAQAKTPQEKAEAYVRAGKILEEKGDRDGAVERYKRALDADENCASATGRLRELYAQRGDAQGAIEMLQREIEAADGVLARAKLWADVARIYRDKVGDKEKAGEAAQKAVLLDASNEDASALLGELKYEAGDYAEAVRLLAPRAGHAKELGKDEGLRIALRYGEALAKAGEDSKALEAFRLAREISPNDRGALLAVAGAAFGIGKFEQARELYAELLQKFGSELEKGERAIALSNKGQSAAKLGDASAAVRALAEAAELEPNNTKVLDALASAWAQQGKWDEVVKVKAKRIEASPAAEKYELHIELGELLATKVGDKTRAARSYLSALETRPEDRKLLTKLMQLYSEERDWGRLVEVILRLADLVDEPTQLSKYYLTAAQLCHLELNRADEAIDYYELALEHDPASDRAIEGLAAVREAKKDFAGLEQSYQKILAKLKEKSRKESAAKLHALLGELYAKHLNNVVAAIESYERAQELDTAVDHSERLAELYLKDSKRHFDKAVRAQRGLLQKNSQRTESYKALRKLYTESKRPDEAWCFCQALTALKAAEPEEENFFKKFRTDTPVPAGEKMTDELWVRDLAHPHQDPTLTAIFASVLPAVFATRAQKLSEYELTDKNKLDLEKDKGQMAHTIRWGAGVLGLKVPLVYAKPQDESGVGVLLTDPPGFLLGKAGLAGGPAQPLAFIAGSKLAYFRPGFFIRQLVPTGTGLRAWLFAAFRVVNPAFPVTPELTAAVQENTTALKEHIRGPALETLTSHVSRLLNMAGSLDLKRWTIGVELTADRAGFLLAGDLPRSLAVIRATPEEQAPLPAKDRIRELVLFATSEEYFHLRQRLGIAIRPAGT